MDILSKRLLQAIEFTAMAHKTQYRKHSLMDTPYVSHVFAVAMILDRAGYNEDTVIAGLLHDVIEDTEFTYENIKERFGDVVADMVLGVTENAELPWYERKIDYLENLKKQNDNVKAISAADMLANRLDYLKSFEEGFDAKKTLSAGVTAEIYREIDEKRMDVVGPVTDKQIIQQLEEVINKIQKYFFN